MEIKKLSNNDLLQLIRSITLELENREHYQSLVDKIVTVSSVLSKSANQQRAELIERARDFVEDRTKKSLVVMNESRHYSCRESFIVNAEKRTVVCLMKGVITKKTRKIGIAKCNPSDVFNADIGKAIALARALKIDVPQEFMRAVQPDEKVVGMIVYDEKTTNISKTKVVIKDGWASNGECHISSISARRAIIIDDTNAIYGEGDK